MKALSRRCLAIFTLSAGLAAAGCSKIRLIEQFDMGPVTRNGLTMPGKSEGYFWVDQTDQPTEGKQWRNVDPDTLTPEQKDKLPPKP
ncbi:MAG: hypothetical protein HEQ23_09565 [Tepidisphaera sp.]